jgi:hypothetical protein
MRLEHKMMEDQEDKFWADGGIYEQMRDRVSEYIKEHRNVTDVKFDIKLGFDEIAKKETDLQNAGVYRDFVSFSAYPDDYTDNLDEVAVKGRVQFRQPYQAFFGGMAVEARADYKSEILEDPTWLEVALCANDAINITGDNHHIFLEGIYQSEQWTLDDKSFVLIYKFSMGS